MLQEFKVFFAMVVYPEGYKRVFKEERVLQSVNIGVQNTHGKNLAVCFPEATIWSLLFFRLEEAFAEL